MDIYNRSTLKVRKIMSKNDIITKNRILPFIQISMAVVYILFGWLKLLWWSPAEELVFLSTSFVNFDWFYPLLGFWEVWLGILFLHLKRFRKWGFRLFLAHMIGTFLPFVTTPELCVWICEEGLFNHPTFTIVWQYIIKNVSLIGCWLVLKFSK